jgi:hypothetical protein
MIIAATTADRDYAQFVGGIIAALNAGGIITIASAVDSPELLAHARALGIAAVHGDLLGKPYPIMAYAEIVGSAHPQISDAGIPTTPPGAAPAAWQLNYNPVDRVDLREPASQRPTKPQTIGDALAQEFGLNLGDDPGFA